MRNTPWVAHDTTPPPRTDVESAITPQDEEDATIRLYIHSRKAPHDTTWIQRGYSIVRHRHWLCLVQSNRALKTVTAVLIGNLRQHVQQVVCRCMFMSTAANRCMAWHRDTKVPSKSSQCSQRLSNFCLLYTLNTSSRLAPLGLVVRRGG